MGQDDAGAPQSHLRARSSVVELPFGQEQVGECARSVTVISRETNSLAGTACQPRRSQGRCRCASQGGARGDAVHGSACDLEFAPASIRCGYVCIYASVFAPASKRLIMTDACYYTATMKQSETPRGSKRFRTPDSPPVCRRRRPFAQACGLAQRARDPGWMPQAFPAACSGLPRRVPSAVAVRLGQWRGTTQQVMGPRSAQSSHLTPMLEDMATLPRRPAGTTRGN